MPLHTPAYAEDGWEHQFALGLLLWIANVDGGSRYFICYLIPSGVLQIIILWARVLWRLVGQPKRSRAPTTSTDDAITFFSLFLFCYQLINKLIRRGKNRKFNCRCLTCTCSVNKMSYCVGRRGIKWL